LTIEKYFYEFFMTFHRPSQKDPNIAKASELYYGSKDCGVRNPSIQ